jgi:hypothetical protein
MRDEESQPTIAVETAPRYLDTSIYASRTMDRRMS